jgi:hypothetical protein
VALVSREVFFGPCAGLARSRRLRRYYPDSIAESACPLAQNRRCPPNNIDVTDPYTKACYTNNADQCDDLGDSTVLPSVIELRQPMTAMVLGDLTPLLVGINEDVRPTTATIEGIIGTELLQQLVGTIDYPGRRLFARCVGPASQCVAYAGARPGGFGECVYCPTKVALGPLNACPVAP